jgi:hypothetical protein
VEIFSLWGDRKSVKGPDNLGNFSASAPRASLDMYVCNQ